MLEQFSSQKTSEWLNSPFLPDWREQRIGRVFVSVQSPFDISLLSGSSTYIQKILFQDLWNTVDVRKKISKENKEK